MLRAVIIDDEPSGIKSLQLLINKHVSEVNVIAASTNAEEGIAFIRNYKPDIVFLDINMPDLDGFGLLDRLESRSFDLVFTTAHREYAIQAIRHDAVDYLLKPVDEQELKNCVARIIARSSKTNATQGMMFSNTIGLTVKDGINFIKTAEIIRLEASGSYTIFYLDNNVRQVASKNIKEYEIQLNPSVFFRCHNSHLINLKKVVKLISNNGFLAQMTDGSTAEIARKNKEHLLEKLAAIGE
jgi:two-component system, LytTR family, response regulator